MDKRNRGFTLIEVLIVVVLIAVLAGTIIPQFANSTKDAKISNVLFNQSTMRSQIEAYQAHHDGAPPSATLVEMISSTNSAGDIGTGASYPYGPYMKSVPDNSITNSNAISVITNSPALASDVTGNGGWLYNTTTGGIWVDHADYFQK